MEDYNLNAEMLFVLKLIFEIHDSLEGNDGNHLNESRENYSKFFHENMNVAKRGGQVANDARKSYEKQTKKSAISKNNALNYKYIDDEKLIEDKKRNSLIKNIRGGM